MDDFERMTVELQIGMRKEDNEELFKSVHSQLFGYDEEDDTDADMDSDFDNEKNAEEAFDYDNGIDADYEDF